MGDPRSGIGFAEGPLNHSPPNLFNGQTSIAMQPSNHLFHKPDLGLLLLRLSVGGLMLPHGIAKIIGSLEPIQGMLTAKGLPAVLSYGVYLGEIVAPILILLGYFGRPAAIVFALTMAVSMFLAYGLSGFGFNQYGGLNVELNLLFMLGALTLFFTGSGRCSIRKGANPWD